MGTSNNKTMAVETVLVPTVACQGAQGYRFSVHIFWSVLCVDPVLLQVLIPRAVLIRKRPELRIV